jgi:lysyl-tRNA synthetase class 2
MEDINEHIQSRINKLNALRDEGIEPYGGIFEYEDTAATLLEKYEGRTKESLEKNPSNGSVAGRLVAMRDFGKASFAHLQDSTGRVQIYFKKDILVDAYKVVKKLDIGDIVGVRGTLFRTKTGELTLQVNELRLLTKSIRPLPEKWHGLKDIELRYRQRYVDLIVNPDVKDTFRKRSIIVKAIRDFMEDEDFMEVETPMMQSIPGGATAKPFKTHHNALNMDLFLRIAPELYLKRLLVGGFERVFEINRNFRNEGISTKHNPEFTMLEFYAAYKDYNFLMDFTERLIPHVAKKATGSMKIKYQDGEIDLTPPWPRVPMLQSLADADVPADVLKDEARARAWAADNGIKVDPKCSFGKVLDEIFSERVEPNLIQPTFITQYPVELSPLAKRNAENLDFVDRFELFIAGREIANAFSELNDPMDQMGRFQDQEREREAGDEESHLMDRDFVRALEYGMPPAAGEGIGIDRLVMLLTDNHSIRDVLLFPHLRPEATAEDIYLQKISKALSEMGVEAEKQPTGFFNLRAAKGGVNHYISARHLSGDALPELLERFYASASSIDEEGAKFLFVTNQTMSGNQRNKVKSQGRKIDRNLSAVSGGSAEELKKQLEQIIR